MYHFGEACKGLKEFVQRVKHSMTFWLLITVRLSTGHRKWGTRLKNEISGGINWCNSSKTLNESYSQLLIELERYHRSCVLWPSAYVIEKPFSFTSIINDMKRVLKKVFNSKKPSLGTMHDGLGPATLTSTSTGPTDLMLSIPACDSESDRATSAQVTAVVSVRVQLHPSHLYVFTYCYRADRP